MIEEPSARQEQALPNRRGFLGTIALALAGGVATAAAAVAGIFTLGPALRGGEKSGEGRCSPVPAADLVGSDGPTLHTVTVRSSAGWAEASVLQAIYLDRGPDGTPRAFSARCPHEGCRVNWEADARQYVCPCHQSSWNRDGVRLSGPAKRGLDPLPVQPGPNGTYEVCHRTFALDTADRVEVG
jgi:menaquinol-cytochrome c reductase iron-sulfur subunit